MALSNYPTEQDSNHQNLEALTLKNILLAINQEDKTVPFAVEKAIHQIEILADAVYKRMKEGGRLFYIGAGTSGRLGVVDASECPPTFGVEYDRVIGLIAGGDTAIRRAVENAEDDPKQAYQDLLAAEITTSDIVIGIAASGRTPYVVGGLSDCKKQGISTGCIVCNFNSEAAQVAHYPVEVIVGPEFITGSTRMKAGTAQKLVLNMISTSVMIKLGHVKGNKMIDMQLTNSKLNERALRIVKSETGLSDTQAQQLLNEFGSVRLAIDAALKQKQL